MSIEVTDEMIEIARRSLRTCSCEGCVGRAIAAVAPLILEECAKVAEEFIDLPISSCPSDNARAIAENLRALASRPISEREGPDWNELRGVAPDATGDQSSEAFIREQRDSWER